MIFYNKLSSRNSKVIYKHLTLCLFCFECENQNDISIRTFLTESQFGKQL